MLFFHIRILVIFTHGNKEKYTYICILLSISLLFLDINGTFTWMLGFFDCITKIKNTCHLYIHPWFHWLRADRLLRSSKQITNMIYDKYMNKAKINFLFFKYSGNIIYTYDELSSTSIASVVLLLVPSSLTTSPSVSSSGRRTNVSNVVIRLSVRTKL